MAVFPIGFVQTQQLPQPNEMIPIGGIALWSGAILDIPAGWALCDGNNGTPNLRDKFVVGAGDLYAVDAAGGVVDHAHSFATDGHAHSIQTTHACPGAGGITAWSSLADSNMVQDNNDSGTTDQEDNLPPYLALAYIMRLV
jgi:hypothetical protein